CGFGKRGWMRKVWAVFLLWAGVQLHGATFDVKSFGAKGDGKTAEREAILRAIDAAAAAGGGTVYFPAGAYVTGSVRLKSNVTLQLDSGTVIEASADAAAYDAPEPNQWDKFQDFGHSHFHNALIWGEGLENVAIVGSGLLHGKGLTRNDRGPGGDKLIALKLCRNVTLRDFSILNGGHFGILATGADDLTHPQPRVYPNPERIELDGCPEHPG